MTDQTALLQAILDELVKLNVGIKYLVKAGPWVDGSNPTWCLETDQAKAVNHRHTLAAIQEANGD